MISVSQGRLFIVEIGYISTNELILSFLFFSWLLGTSNQYRYLKEVASCTEYIIHI